MERVAQSVELLLDDELDAAVRREWRLLLDAGPPSQARHTGESNAPHVTVGVATSVTEAADAALAPVHPTTGPDICLGGHLVFGGERFVLSRLVVPSADLLAIHHQVHEAWNGMPGLPGTMRPGRWTPHVTLARWLDPTQLAAALEVLRHEPRELVGKVGALRRWDPETRTTWEPVVQ